MGIIKDILNIKSIKSELFLLKEEKSKVDKKLADLDGETYFSLQEKIKELEEKYHKLSKDFEDGETCLSLQEKIKELEEKYHKLNKDFESEKLRISSECKEKQQLIDELVTKITELTSKSNKLDSTITNQQNKVSRLRRLHTAIKKSLASFHDDDKLIPINESEAELLIPTVELKLHCMDIKSLKKEYKENQKLIDSALESYSKRYTTKANKSIYSLMVIALRSELQNILYNLKFQKLDSAIDDVKTVTKKYLAIVDNGNQHIANTLHKFIDEIEYLFINAVKIEYNYYVKKEQAKQEQLAIRQQIREEAEERKALLQQQKKIEKEEEKFKNELSKFESLLSSTSDSSEIEKLNARILELQAQLSDVIVKKDEIIKLQNGKAGNVYIISNLGSFGDDVFKIGMTRRLNPQDRIDELGSASVPFKFDVHSFIFSENASDLETEIHKKLNDKRLNKVNMRKEFFKLSIEELEKLVNEIEPTAEFNKTMLAQEFRQSLSTDENYSSIIEEDFDEEDDD